MAATVARPGDARIDDVPVAARRMGVHTLLDRERTFGAEEIIVSKTDLRGVITYANDVFARTAGYSRAELEGRPHSIVRHPHFPGGVFRLLWDTITADREIFAFVKNLAKDGSYYWVLAHVTPTHGRDGQISGYHSSRRVPERAALDELSGLYAEMLDIERDIRNLHEAAEASATMVAARLASLGTTYDEFVWDIINRTGQEI